MKTRSAIGLSLFCAIFLTSCGRLRAPTLSSGGLTSPFYMAPYLAVTRSGSLVLRWWTSVPREVDGVRLHDGVEEEQVTARQADSVRAITLPKKCRIEGDGQKITYFVNGMLGPQTVTLPPCSTVASTRFVFITDTQNHRDKVAVAAMQIAELAPDFVLHGGDLVEMGTNDQQWVDYQHAVSAYGRSVATIATLGNHETYMDGDFPNFRRFYVGEGPTWYLFTAGPVDVIVLDSERINDDEVDQIQLRWFEDTLKKLSERRNKKRRWTLVLTHHAPLSTSIANSPLVPFGRSGGLRKRYVPLIEKYSVDLVLAGHTHVYERLHQKGIDYVVGGAAGGMMGILGSAHKSSKIIKKTRTISTFEVGPKELIMRTLDQEGHEVDRLELRR
jgi:predicted phosphodiesterase